MRDLLKDEVYFESKIRKLIKDIDTYETLLLEVIKENGTDCKGAKNGRMILVKEYINLIDCECSYGADKLKLSQYYKRLIQIYSESYLDHNSYTQLIKIISLGILLDMDAGLFSVLEKELNQKDREDYFVNYLLGSIEASWNKGFDCFSYPGFYEPLKEVIEQKDIKQLIHYDQKYWYKSHNEEAWYNSHKSKRNTYCGYWDYEGAAVAKILKINATQLPNLKYFPYDFIG